MSEHTSGPFRVHAGRYVKEDLSIIGLSEDSGRMLAAVHGGKNSGQFFVNDEAEVAANARLFAAAPDLLEALREMVACDAEAIEDAERIGIPFPDEMLATYNKACAAIAKATGERP